MVWNPGEEVTGGGSLFWSWVRHDSTVGQRWLYVGFTATCSLNAFLGPRWTTINSGLMIQYPASEKERKKKLWKNWGKSLKNRIENGRKGKGSGVRCLEAEVEQPSSRLCALFRRPSHNVAIAARTTFGKQIMCQPSMNFLRLVRFLVPSMSLQMSTKGWAWWHRVLIPPLTRGRGGGQR